jgi:hypothetical protein
MKEYFQKCWKGLAVFITVLTMATVTVNFYRNLATAEDLAQVKTEFKASMALERDLNKLDRVNENILRLKIQQRDFDGNAKMQKVIEADLNAAMAEKAKLQEKIDKR